MVKIDGPDWVTSACRNRINRFLRGNADLLKGPVFYMDDWTEENVRVLRAAGWVVKEKEQCLIIYMKS